MRSFTIYNTETSDFPGQFVGREFSMDRPKVDNYVAAGSLEEVRDWVRDQSPEIQLVRIPRDDTDDPVIMETWL